MDWQAENRKVTYLERLYRRDGRDRKDHPFHDTYTGLVVARAAELIEWERSTTKPA